MTVTTNARVAGFTFWIYIGAGIGTMLLAGNKGVAVPAQRQPA